MLKYKLRCPPQGELIKKTSMEILQMIVDVFNLGGFSFSPHKNRPEIQEFMDKYPNLIAFTSDE